MNIRSFRKYFSTFYTIIFYLKFFSALITANNPSPMPFFINCDTIFALTLTRGAGFSGSLDITLIFLYNPRI